jgi:uncharacterized membrane protein SpoIIM required for sporulation
LFFGLGLLTFLLVFNNPAIAAEILPESSINQFKEMYSNDISEGRELPMNFVASSFYIRNNVSIAFFSFDLGITLGLGTLYLITYNGIFIGAVLGIVAASGHGFNLFSFIVAHSVFELLGICIAGGAGLALGLAVIRTKTEKKSISLSKKAREIVPLILVAAFFITIAAFIEGFLSPSAAPLAIKILTAVSSFIIIFIYLSRYVMKRSIRKFNRIKRRLQWKN